MDWRMLIPVLICGIAIGYHIDKVISDREIAELKEQHLHLVAEINQKSNEEYSKILDELTAKQAELNRALGERDKALSAGRAVRSDAERLRRQLAAAADSRESTKMPAGNCSCEHERTQLSSCVRLLSEGVGLAGEGSEFSLRLASERDAAVSLFR